MKFDLQTVIPYLKLGPRVYYPLHVDDQFKNISDNDYKKILLGLTFGGGIEIDKKLPVCLIIEFLYSNNINNFYNSKVYKIKNQSFEILLGFKI